jgi:hypothetical protein
MRDTVKFIQSTFFFKKQIFELREIQIDLADSRVGCLCGRFMHYLRLQVDG